MGKDSKISWTHHTFNGWIGCTKVSPGCKFCYAEEWDKRFKEGKNWGPGAPRELTKDGNWSKPITWNAEAKKNGIRTRVFTASLSDVFDVEVKTEWRERLWNLIKKTPNLDWLLLTKRTESINSMLPADWGNGYENAWVGTTVENQEMANKRIPILADVKAKIRFLSVEPQIEEIDFSKMMDKKNFDWLIFGGESGNPEEIREFNPEWIKTPLEEAKKAGIARFVKQMGTIWAVKNQTKDNKAGDPDEWAEEFRVREFPV